MDNAKLYITHVADILVLNFEKGLGLYGGIFSFKSNKNVHCGNGMRVNLKCLLDCITGCTDSWLNIISPVSGEGIFRRD